MATETKVQDLSVLLGGSATATEEKPTPAATKEAEESEEEEEEKEGEESESEEEEKEESEEEEGEKEEESEEVTDEKKDPEDEDEDEDESGEIDLDAALKEEFEDYGIENKESLVETLEGGLKALERVEELEKEIEVLKKAEPVFKSDGQKKIFEYLKDYDPEKFADGLHTFATLVSMDVAKADPKMILEQEFLMENPEIPVDKARKKFDKLYSSKYLLDRDSFEGTDKEYQDKIEDMELDRDMAANKARKVLKVKQQEFKVQSEDKVTEPEVNKEIESGIEKTSNEFSKHLDGLTSLTYMFGKDDGISEEVEFSYSFPKDKLKQIEGIVMTHLKNPAAYDAKGKLKGEFNPEALFQQAAKMVDADKMILEAYKAGLRKADITTADKIAKKKPNRTAKTGGEMKATSIMGQFTALSNKMTKEKATQKR